MWPFKKKEKKIPSTESYNMNDKLFPISTPYGYSPKHVSEAIVKYSETIESQKDVILKLREALARERKEKQKIDMEYKALQLQMNFVNIPSMNDIQENFIQNKFQEHFSVPKEEEDDYNSKASSKISMINAEMNLEDSKIEEEIKEKKEEKKEKIDFSKEKISNEAKEETKIEDSNEFVPFEVREISQEEKASFEEIREIIDLGIEPKQTKDLVVDILEESPRKININRNKSKAELEIASDDISNILDFVNSNPEIEKPAETKIEIKTKENKPKKSNEVDDFLNKFKF